jgi:replicative DNA helicase
MIEDTKNKELAEEVRAQRTPVPLPDNDSILPAPDSKLIDARIDALLSGSREGIKTRCFPLLDQITHGLTDVITLTGPPGIGKSAWAWTIALAVSEAGDPVLYYSLEMPPEEMTRRALIAESRYEKWDLLKEDKKEIGNSRAKVSRKTENLFTIGRIAQNGSSQEITPDLILEHVEEVKVIRKKAPLVVIDHGRYVEGCPGTSEYERDQNFYKAIQAIPQETGATILLIVEQSKGTFGTAKMESAKGTVSSAYDASTVLVLWDPELKEANEDPAALKEYTGEANETEESKTKTIYLAIQKNRNGQDRRKIGYTFFGPTYLWKEIPKRTHIA